MKNLEPDALQPRCLHVAYILGPTIISMKLLIKGSPYFPMLHLGWFTVFSNAALGLVHHIFWQTLVLFGLVHHIFWQTLVLFWVGSPYFLADIGFIWVGSPYFLADIGLVSLLMTLNNSG